MRYNIYLKRKDGKTYKKEGVGHSAPIILEETEYSSPDLPLRTYKLVKTKCVGISGSIEHVVYEEV